MTDITALDLVSHGIDVASFQHDGGPIDYKAAIEDLVSRTTGGRPATDFATPITVFVIVKITDSNNYANPFAAQDVDGFASVDIPNVVVNIHLYHFLHAGADAASQRAYALAHVPQGCDPLYWVDVEGGGLDGLGWGQFASVVNQSMLFPEIVGAYTNGEGLGSVEPYLDRNGVTKPLWFADPSNTRPEVKRAITQVGTGPVAGIVGDVDLDTAPMSLIAALPAAKTSAAPAPVVEPTPTPEPAPTPVEVPQPSPKGLIDMLPLIVEGSSDDFHVSLIQAALVIRGYNLGNSGPHGDGVDGAFGPMTLSQVLLFQHRSGLTADGKVGPLTYAKLLEAA